MEALNWTLWSSKFSIKGWQELLTPIIFALRSGFSSVPNACDQIIINKKVTGWIKGLKRKLNTPSAVKES